MSRVCTRNNTTWVGEWPNHERLLQKLSIVLNRLRKSRYSENAKATVKRRRTDLWMSSWVRKSRIGPKRQSILAPKRSYLVLSYGMRRNYFFCDSKRVRSSKKRGTKFLKWCPAGGVRGHHQKEFVPPLCTPPCGRCYHWNSISANSTRFRVLQFLLEEVGNTLATWRCLQIFIQNCKNFPMKYEVRSKKNRTDCPLSSLCKSLMFLWINLLQHSTCLVPMYTIM